MKNNEIIPIDEQKYYHLLDHEEMRIVDIDHLSKFVSTIYHHCIFPISKGKDFNKEWKSGKMYKLSKGGITIFCTAYTNGQMSFFITTPTKDEYDYFYVIEYQAEKDIEKNLDYYFEQISEWIIKSITSKKHLGQQSFEEKWITIFINRAEVFDKENIFGLENVGIERISRFIRAMQDISYIRLYVFPESIMEQGGAIIPKTSLRKTWKILIWIH